MQIEYSHSPNYSSRRGASIDAIVVHSTADDKVGGTLAWFANKNSRVSAHYTISKKGKIYKHVDEANKAWHAGRSNLYGRSNVNKFSIGIELTNKNDGKDSYPTVQLKSLAWLVNDIAKRHKIPAKRVVGHVDISPGRKTDPRNFPWDKFWGIMRDNHWPKKQKIANLPTLRRGSKGDAVKKLQRLLGGLVVDGRWGWRTTHRVKQFQRANGLKVDAIAGKRTWGKLVNH